MTEEWDDRIDKRSEVRVIYRTRIADISADPPANWVLLSSAKSNSIRRQHDALKPVNRL